jgi:hypothetical protein
MPASPSARVFASAWLADSMLVRQVDDVVTPAVKGCSAPQSILAWPRPHTADERRP